MKKLLIFCLSLFLITACHPDFNRKEPIRVVVKDLVEKTDGYIVERRMYYTLDSVVIDTIQINNQSSLHIPESYLNNVPDDVVDLNDIFSSGEDDPTDYNYTELEESEWQYLDSLGVYWDEDLGYWRKRK